MNKMGFYHSLNSSFMKSRLSFLRHLKERDLKGTQLFVGDKCLGLIEALIETYPLSRFQRCMVHFYRNVFSVVPRGKVKQVAAMLKAIHAREDKGAALDKLEDVVGKLKEMKLFEAAKKVEETGLETLATWIFPGNIGDGSARIMPWSD